MTTNLIDAIEIKGIRELQAALKALDGESQKRLRIVFNEAAELVVAVAAPKVPTVSGAARKSVRARSGQRNAIVMGGSARVPYYGWLDFGGKAGNGVRRYFQKSGRYIYPAYTAKRPIILAQLTDALVALAHDAGLDVTP